MGSLLCYSAWAGLLLSSASIQPYLLDASSLMCCSACSQLLCLLARNLLCRPCVNAGKPVGMQEVYPNLPMLAGPEQGAHPIILSPQSVHQSSARQQSLLKSKAARSARRLSSDGAAPAAAPAATAVVRGTAAAAKTVAAPAGPAGEARTLHGQHESRRALRSARGAWVRCACTVRGRLAWALTGVMVASWWRGRGREALTTATQYCAAAGPLLQQASVASAWPQQDIAQSALWPPAAAGRSCC